jgi:hypothetical protein
MCGGWGWGRGRGLVKFGVREQAVLDKDRQQYWTSDDDPLTHTARPAPQVFEPWRAVPEDVQLRQEAARQLRQEGRALGAAEGRQTGGGGGAGGGELVTKQQQQHGWIWSDSGQQQQREQEQRAQAAAIGDVRRWWSWQGAGRQSSIKGSVDVSVSLAHPVLTGRGAGQLHLRVAYRESAAPGAPRMRGPVRFRQNVCVVAGLVTGKVWGDEVGR